MKAIDKIEAFEPCLTAIEWLKSRTIEQLVDECRRGDWMLWLAVHLRMDYKILMQAKVKCVKTASHLMVDKNAIASLETAEKFSLGTISRDEFQVHLGNYLHPTYNLQFTYVAADAAALFACYFDDYTYKITDLNVAAYVADAFANTCDNYREGAKLQAKSRLDTANICREVFGQLMKDLLNAL